MSSNFSEPLSPPSSSIHTRGGDRPARRTPRQEYVYFTVLMENLRRRLAAECQAIGDMSLNSDYAQLFEKTTNEFIYGADCPRSPQKGAGKTKFLRRCHEICDHSPKDTREAIIQYQTAMNVGIYILTCELDDTPGQYLEWEREVHAKLGDPRLGQPAPPIETTKIDAFDGADLLDWVGIRFTDRTSRVEYLVEDAGTSATIGQYFELRTQDGQLRKITTMEFQDMVAGIPIPDRESLPFLF